MTVHERWRTCLWLNVLMVAASATIAAAAIWGWPFTPARARAVAVCMLLTSAAMITEAVIRPEKKP